MAYKNLIIKYQLTIWHGPHGRQVDSNILLPKYGLSWRAIWLKLDVDSERWKSYTIIAHPSQLLKIMPQ